MNPCWEKKKVHYLFFLQTSSFFAPSQKINTWILIHIEEIKIRPTVFLQSDLEKLQDLGIEWLNEF